MGFEPTIPAQERAKSVHALDRAATLIGQSISYSKNFQQLMNPNVHYRVNKSLNYYYYYYYYYYYSFIIHQ
jgi:hypothetical protein